MMQVLDLRSWTWSKIEAKISESNDSAVAGSFTPCAGHSLVSILSIAYSNFIIVFVIAVIVVAVITSTVAIDIILIIVPFCYSFQY